MAFEFHLPDLAEGMAEAEVVSWKVKEGEPVELDQPIVEVMSDKATVEIPSPRAGTLSKIHYQEGEVGKVGEVLFIIDEAGAAASPPPAPGAPTTTAVTPPVQTAVPAKARGGAAEGTMAPPLGGTTRGASGRVLATPSTRRLARQLGVDSAQYELRGNTVELPPMM